MSLDNLVMILLNIPRVLFVAATALLQCRDGVKEDVIHTPRSFFGELHRRPQSSHCIVCTWALPYVHHFLFLQIEI